MGGVPCKVVIDQAHGAIGSLEKHLAALRKAFGCMTASVLLNYETTAPTQQVQDEFTAAVQAFKADLGSGAESLARLAAKIERYVSTGDDSYAEEPDALDGGARPVGGAT